MLTFIATLDVPLACGKPCGITLVRQADQDSDYWVFTVKPMPNDELRNEKGLVHPEVLKIIEGLASVAVGEPAYWTGTCTIEANGRETWLFSGDELAVPFPENAKDGPSVPLSYPND